MAKKKANESGVKDVTKENNNATFKELFNRIECDTGLVFVDTPEETRLIREVYKEYSSQSVQFWSIRFGMHSINSETTESPEEFMPHDYNPGNARVAKSDSKINSRNGLAETLAIIEEDCREKLDPEKPPSHKTIYILRDADKYFQNPALLRVVRDIIYLASCSASTIIMTGFGITIPNDLIKDAVFMKISYPTREEITANIIPLVKNQIEEHNKTNTNKELQIDPNFDEEAVARACAGLTEDQILNVLQYTTTVDNQVNIDRILEEKRSIINTSDILEYWICDTSLADVGGFGELKKWFHKRKHSMTSPYAKKFRAKYPKGIMLIGVQGSGKAMPISSKVLMSDKNWKRLGDIVIGDKVATPNGRLAKVQQIFEHPTKESIRIEFKDGRYADCCEDHLWKIYNKNFKCKSNKDGWKVVDTKELLRLMIQKYDTRRFYVPLLEDSGLGEELPIHPYILGILLGDGHISNNIVSFTTKDQEVADRVKSFLRKDYVVSLDSNENKCNSYRIIKGTSQDEENYYITQLSLMGLYGKLSNSKFIPDICYRLSFKDKKYLLQGLMDSDGSTDNSLSYSTTSPYLAAGVQHLVRSIGGMAWSAHRDTCYTYQDEKKEGQSSFRVNIRYKNPKDLVYLPRKKETLSNEYQYSDLKLEIVNVEKTGLVEDMRCITLDNKDHLYITNDYIVTHNTYIGKSVAATLGMGLIKLEMGKVFAGLVGESEKRMRQALAQIEAAGGIVMVDEIDKGLSGAGSSDRSDGGTTSRVIGTLLTWLQEEHPGVFLIATANDISNLLGNHPELLRKGRFDEIWFSDLPTEEEREEIFKIHLSKLDRDPSKFDLSTLANISYHDDETGREFGYTGAEIEYACADAVTETFAEGEGKEMEIGGEDDITTEDLANCLKIIKPMSKVGFEPINKMRRWAKNNARNVSTIAVPIDSTPKPTAKRQKKGIGLRGKRNATVECDL